MRHQKEKSYDSGGCSGRSQPIRPIRPWDLSNSPNPTTPLFILVTKLRLFVHIPPSPAKKALHKTKPRTDTTNILSLPRRLFSPSSILPFDHRSPQPDTHTMAALIKAANAKIRSNPVSDYICSTRTYLLFLVFSFGLETMTPPFAGPSSSPAVRKVRTAHDASSHLPASPWGFYGRARELG